MHLSKDTLSSTPKIDQLAAEDMVPSTPNAAGPGRENNTKTLTWTFPRSEDLYVETFFIYQSSAPDRFPSTPLASVSGSTFKYTAQNLSVGEAYYYKVSAKVKGMGEQGMSAAPSEKGADRLPSGRVLQSATRHSYERASGTSRMVEVTICLPGGNAFIYQMRRKSKCLHRSPRRRRHLDFS